MSRTSQKQKAFREDMLKILGPTRDKRNADAVIKALIKEMKRANCCNISEITEEMALSAMHVQHEKICIEKGLDAFGPKQAVILAKRLAIINKIAGTTISMQSAGYEKTISVKCPYCGEQAEYMDSKAIFGRSYGMVYVCLKCDARVGVHDGTNIPKGRMANARLREQRIKAHNAFDALWKGGKMSRDAAYEKVAVVLGVDEFHIGNLDEEECDVVIRLVDNMKKHPFCVDEASPDLSEARTWSVLQMAGKVFFADDADVFEIKEFIPASSIIYDRIRGYLLPGGRGIDEIAI